MENSIYLQIIQKGFKASTKSVLLINISFAVLISAVINATEPNWDFTLRDGIFLTLLNISAFVVSIFMGIVLVGLVLAVWKSRLSNMLVILFSCIIGIMPLIVVNYVLWNLFFIPDFRNFETFIGQFLPLYIVPDISNILVLVYAVRKMIDINSPKESLFAKVN